MTRALVIGGSMAGMCAARVLANHFDEVVVLDRDSYPSRPEHRIGVPQSHHAHALLTRGQTELERLFPGFEKAMTDRGARKLDAQQGFAILRKWGWATPSRSGHTALWASRPLIDAVLREKMAHVRNVTLRDKTSVVDLRIERSPRPRVSGVVIKGPEGNTTIDADLVVDATGRGSKAPHWFDAAGLDRPKDDIVEAFAGYSSRFYRRPPEDKRPKDWWWDGLWIEGVPPSFPRGAVAFPIEDNLWLVTAVGFAKDYPPGDPEGFVAFLRSLASPIVAESVAVCEPVSDVAVSRSTTNRFRHYETWKSELDAFLAIGDSVCAFNPVYGQGMSTAAASARELEGAIREVGIDPRRLPKAHFAAQAKFLKSVWQLAAGADFVWPTTTGDRPSGAALFRPYFLLLGESVHCDAAVMRRVAPVAHLVDHPSKVLSPPVVAAVLFSTLKRRLTVGVPSIPRGSMPPETPAR